MLTIEENIEQERSIIRKKVNRRTILSVKNLSQKQDYQLPLRIKLHTDRSQNSIKQRSLDETDFKKAKMLSTRPKPVEKTQRKKDKTCKNKGEPTKSSTNAKLLQREPPRTTPKRSEGRSITRETEELLKVRATAPKPMEKEKQKSRKQGKKARSPTERNYPSLPRYEKARSRDQKGEISRFRNITLNDEILRMFEATQSKIVEQDELSSCDCQLLELIYNRLSGLDFALGGQRTKIASELLGYSNRLPERLRNFGVWKWMLVAVMLSERTIPEDEERQLNINTLLTYVKINYQLHVENVIDLTKMSLAITKRLKGIIKRQTTGVDRSNRLAKNTDIIRSIVSLILSSEAADKLIENLVSEEDEWKFYGRYFELWRERGNSPFLPPIRPAHSHTLCLDLDQTLICFDRSNGKLLVRPFVADFLQRMAEHFELVVFTSSLKEYADCMIDQIDSKRLISYRLYRQSCTTVSGRQRKDLSKLGRDITLTYLVDNLQDNYLLQPKSGLAVSSWYGDPNDRALMLLASKLEKLVAGG